MNWLDILFIVIIVLATIVGMRAGLFGTAFSVIGVLVGWALASQFSDDIGEIVGGSGSGDTIITGIAYIIIVVLTLVAARIIWRIVRPILSGFTLGLSNMADRLGGAALGVLIGFALTGALIVLLGRLTYDFAVPDLPGGNISDRAARLIPDPERTRAPLERSLSESAIVPIFIDVTSVIPGGALGFVPWDFQASLEVLEQNIS